ncbi:olfactory receptor 11L1-like [Microcaecilia unicolor]|uniref:Olfactory receptor n=1 Tax=Microcaecilia unicolor TaxID=1415580 RepID=A0A6P7WGW6_9AMPH|nr:olfactory receptor 11L1-like [Microcaecilia unicolor]
MTEGNITGTNFEIVGFQLTQTQGSILFLFFLLIYILSTSTNILIITVVRTDRHLHKPMYFFLSNFSFLEIWYTSVTVPRMLADFLSKSRSISRNGCITQFYFLFFLGATENFLLAVMSLDRFVAICYPLRYPAVMNDKMCSNLALASWIISFLVILMPAIPLSQLPFCRPFVIDHIFCDFSPLLKLSCKRNSISEMSFLLIAWAVILGCFTSIMVSYSFIILTVIKMPSAAGRKHAFTTCASHLLVVFIYYGTVIFMYVRPSAHESYNLDKVVSVFYCAVTPLLNPIIYSLRNKEVKTALRRMIIKLK